jgi:DNA-binding transcriptional LysR family regulator
MKEERFLNQLKQYEYVLAIVEKGGITQAAEELQIAQPTLSRYLHKLEDKIGLLLFDRSTIPIRLTEAGERYVEAGRRMIDTERQLQKQIQELKQMKDISIRVGISPSRTPYLLPGILSEYQKESSSRVILVEHGINELNNMLMQGDLDLIFSHLDETTQDFTCIEMFDEVMLLAIPKNSLKDSIKTCFQTTPVISLPKGTRTGDLLYEMLACCGVKEPSIHCSSIESALAMVKEGLGITIVPSYIAKFGQDDGLRFEPIPKEMAEGMKPSKFCLFYRKHQFLTKAEAAFIDCTRRVVLRRVEK